VVKLKATTTPIHVRNSTLQSDIPLNYQLPKSEKVEVNVTFKHLTNKRSWDEAIP